jgi:hypothetical protein
MLPIWLTEFGVIWGYEGIQQVQQPDGTVKSAPQGQFRTDLMAAYLDQMFNWLTRNGPAMRIQRWFLYSMVATAEPWATAPAGIGLLQANSTQLTNFGTQYRGWAATGPLVWTTGVFRPSNGALFLKSQNATGFADALFTYGLPGDKPVVGDWSGSGYRSIGIYRNGSFFLRDSNTNGIANITFAFGAPGDLPVVGDWNGDGIETVGVYRDGTFFLRNSNTAGPADITITLGIPGDVPIAGRWTGGTISTVGVFRPSNGALYLRNTNTTGFADITLTYGLPGDKPVTGDWDGNGTDTIGVYRNGTFHLRNSNTNGFADIVFTLGIPSDDPIAGYWGILPPSGSAAQR